jgi:flagellar basal-body rod protein FlgF
MIRGIYSSLSGMLAAMRRQDAVASNVANVNTPGYKYVRPTSHSFEVALSRSTNGAQLGPLALGVVTDGLHQNQSMGHMLATQLSTDLAINGAGLFAVREADGSVGFTRQGSFTRDVEGRLTTPDGALLLDVEGQPIAVPADFGVAVDGTVTPGGQRIAVHAWSDALAYAGNGRWHGAPPPLSSDQVFQGVLEGSNVDLAGEMSEMLVSQRLFGLNARAVSLQLQSTEDTVQLGRLR